MRQTETYLKRAIQVLREHPRDQHTYGLYTDWSEDVKQRTRELINKALEELDK